MWMHDGGDVPTEERGDLAWRDIFADSVVPPHLLLVRTHNLLARAGIHFKEVGGGFPGPHGVRVLGRPGLRGTWPRVKRAVPEARAAHAALREHPSRARGAG